MYKINLKNRAERVRISNAQKLTTKKEIECTTENLEVDDTGQLLDPVEQEVALADGGLVQLRAVGVGAAARARHHAAAHRVDAALQPTRRGEAVE